MINNMEAVELAIKHRAQRVHGLPLIEEKDETSENDDNDNEMKSSSISTCYSTLNAHVIPSARMYNDATSDPLVVADRYHFASRSDLMQVNDLEEHTSVSMLSSADNLPIHWLHTWYNELLLSIHASDKVKSHHLRKRQFLELLNDRECVQCTLTCDICHNKSPYSQHDEHIVDSADIIHDGYSCLNMLQFVTLHRHINLTISIVICRKTKQTLSNDMIITDCFRIESCIYLPHLKRSFSRCIQDALQDQQIDHAQQLHQSNHSCEHCRDLTQQMRAVCLSSNKPSELVCPSIISFIHDVVWLLMEDHMEPNA